MADDIMETKGLTQAAIITGGLSVLAGTDIVANWLDIKRNPTFGASSAPTNAEVLQYLADGGRDITATSEDVYNIGEQLTEDIAIHLRKASRKRTKKDGTPIPIQPLEKRTRAAISSSLRKAAKSVSNIMIDRIEDQKTNTGAIAKKVEEAYADRRKERYGVNESVVYIASSQLANVLIKGRVKVKMSKGGEAQVLKNLYGSSGPLK